MESNNKFVSKIMFSIRIYCIVIFVFMVATWILGEKLLASIEAAVLLLLVVYGVFNRKQKQYQITKYLEKLNFYIDGASNNYLLNFPLPVIVLDLTGTILWYNKKLSNIVGKSVFEQSITDISPDVKVLKMLENKDNISFDIEYNKRFYNIVGNVTTYEKSKEKSYSIILYWIDKTSEVRSNEERINNQIVCCNVLVDNYDEMLKNTTEAERTAVGSKLDSMLEAWADSVDGVYKKNEKDRYSIMLENRRLKDLINKKFEILDSVKEIKLGNKLPPTLSIGIGKGENIKQSNSFSSASLDMALGRGGDQAVIKDNDNFRFFGGRSESMGKSTKVKSRVVAFALRELLDQANEVFIFGHQLCDADSFGAAVGVYKMAKMRGADAYIVLNNIQKSVATMITELEENELYKGAFINETQAFQNKTANSLCVIVDTHNPGYVDAPKLLDNTKNRVLIDHHRRGTEYINNCTLVYHEPYASSTCEMVTEIIQYMMEDPELLPAEAKAIYAGIVLDTKSFSMRTGVRTFEAASFLRRNGVDTVSVKKMFQNDWDLYVKRAKIVSNAEIYKECFAISTWTEEEEQANIVASQAADELLNISGIKASFVLCIKNGIVYVSGRSLGMYNVQLVLEKMGGGGHMTVAGSQISGKSIMDVKEMLKKVIDEIE